MESERELGRQTGPPWLKTPTKPPGYSLTVFSYNLNLILFIFTCQCQARIQTFKMSWFSSKGQTILKCCKIVFLLPVGNTVFSFEVCVFFFSIYLLPNLFIYCIDFALYFVTFSLLYFCLCYKYAKAFDTFWLPSTFLLLSATLIIKTTACKKIIIITIA